MADVAPYPAEVTPGDPASPVGLCTLWTRQERILRGVPSELYAACGNLYSLWGIGLLVRSVLARPTLRYLVVCGTDYADTGRALVALMEHGLAPDGTIPGTETRLQGDLDAAAIARFRARVMLVDLRGCTDPARVATAIRALPPPPAPDDGQAAPCPRVLVPEGWTPPPSAPHAEGKEAPHSALGALRRAQAGSSADEPWNARHSALVEPDPRGNFLIAVERGRVVAVHATTTGGPTGHRFTGRTAAEVYRAILAADLVSRLDHAAYLGAELARAEQALRAGLPYHQDASPR